MFPSSVLSRGEAHVTRERAISGSPRDAKIAEHCYFRVPARNCCERRDGAATRCIRELRDTGSRLCNAYAIHQRGEGPRKARIRMHGRTDGRRGRRCAEVAMRCDVHHRASAIYDAPCECKYGHDRVTYLSVITVIGGSNDWDTASTKKLHVTRENVLYATDWSQPLRTSVNFNNEFGIRDRENLSSEN